MPDESHDPAQLAEWSAFHEQAGSLPDELRSVFDLIYYQGLSQAEVGRGARHLGENGQAPLAESPGRAARRRGRPSAGCLRSGQHIHRELNPMTPGPQDDRIDDLLALWEEKRDEGEAVSAESLCRDCPELASELAAASRRLIAMDRLVDAERRRSDSSPDGPDGVTSATMRAGALHRHAVSCGRRPGPGVHGPGR